MALVERVQELNVLSEPGFLEISNLGVIVRYQLLHNREDFLLADAVFIVLGALGPGARKHVAQAQAGGAAYFGAAGQRYLAIGRCRPASGSKITLAKLAALRRLAAVARGNPPDCLGFEGLPQSLGLKCLEIQDRLEYSRACGGEHARLWLVDVGRWLLCFAKHLKI